MVTGEKDGEPLVSGAITTTAFGASPEGSCMAPTVRVSQMLASGLGLFSPCFSSSWHQPSFYLIQMDPCSTHLSLLPDTSVLQDFSPEEPF